MSDSFILKKLRQPYVFQASVQRRWMTCLLFSTFVFFFLEAFRPFDVSNSPVGLLNACLGYGLTTFVVMALLNIACLPLFPKFMAEERWTVGKEISWSIVNIALIGLGNALFNSFIGNAAFSFQNILVIELYTLAVGVFPVTISVLVKETRLKKRYEQQSELINKELRSQVVTSIEQQETEPEETNIENPVSVIIRSENGKDDLSVRLHDLLYIQSSDNYVEVYYLDRKMPVKKLLRTSLKSVSESLGKYPRLFRCHKSYLVNLEKVTHVSGNAQGYKLHIPDAGDTVPVSRQHNGEIKKRLAGTP